jgi:Spy/CpxP family protein refolding chaperone
MKNGLFAAVVLATALTGTLAAQEMPRGRWWQRPEVARRLSLTADQQQRLDTVYANSANNLIDARGDVEKLQISLRGALDQPQLDRQNIQKIAGRLNEARGKLFERELMMFVDMRGVLTEEQWRNVRQAIAGLGQDPRQRFGNRGGVPPAQQPQNPRRN